MANNHRSLGAFGRRLREIADGIEDNAGEIVRGAALVADQVVVSGTPVLSGRARSGWDVAIGTIPSFVPDGEPSTPEAGAQSALRRGELTIATWNVGDGVIYISNGLPYIRRLDEGYSGQAPGGMTADAALAAREYVRDQKILKGV